MNNTALLLFLLINAALIGAAAAVAVRHAYAHFRPEKHDAEHRPAPAPVKLPPAVRDQLLQKAQVNFEKILDNAAGQLQLDLGKTSAQLNRKFDELGGHIIDDEMKRYRATLDELQRNTETSIATTKDQLAAHQEDLKAAMAQHQTELLEKMKQEVEAEKQTLLNQIDTKLADAAASFLLETLQHDVDLGAQTAYLTTMIEAHKDEFKKEVGHESTTA